VSGRGRPAVEVQGLRTLQRRLKAAGLDLADLKAAHGQMLDVVLADATARVSRRTGRLAASVRGSATPNYAVVRAGRAAVRYAAPIHWGWRAHGIQAQPFLQDAIESNREQLTGLLLHHLEKIIDSIEGTPGA
jgi:hypothetical protein